MDKGSRHTPGSIDPLDDLRTRILHLHRQAGEPSFRDISKRASTPISHTTVREVLRCVKCPRWKLLEAVVTVLRGDVADFQGLWVAVRDAEEPYGNHTHAPLRIDVSDEKRAMIVDVARRNQIQIYRLIDFLERMEVKEDDPKRLAQLTALKELALRVRRDDEALLIVAGDESTQGVRRQAALLVEILQSQATKRPEGRVSVSTIDLDVVIAGPAVYDLGLVISELLDNATAFSPPGSTVTIAAHRTSKAVVVSVEDRGIGISPDQLIKLNDRLAQLPHLDMMIFRMMGLSVVARLAVRHDLQVALKPAAERGTIAEVSVPNTVILPTTNDGPSRPPAIPGPKARAGIAAMQRDQAAALLACMSADQVRTILAGLAAEKAEAVLAQTRSASWPAVTPPPQIARPGLASDQDCQQALA